jgi:hypothetical protein
MMPIILIFSYQVSLKLVFSTLTNQKLYDMIYCM